MKKETKFDYDTELDILHVYTSDLEEIKGGITFGNFTIDVANDGKILGVELEGASSHLNMEPQKLASLDKADILIKKNGNILFIGFTVIKGKENSTIQINVPNQEECIPLSN
ncbi:DUF2283 domain-containing protein [Candidatus Pacearchaeota archaeon]|nr:DUF2283 domain-containing protein [Candidatus Pacearchaeota archaeon]